MVGYSAANDNACDSAVPLVRAPSWGRTGGQRWTTPPPIQQPAGEPLPDGLTRRDRDILAFERQWWMYAGAKEQAIREMFDLSPTRYYQVLNAVIDNPAALAEDPLLVRRLRRLRTSRQKSRSARRLGFDI